MATWKDEVLLEGEFLLLPKKKGLHKVTLTRRGVYYNPISNSGNTYEEKFIQTSDIIGCHLLEPNGIQARTSSVDSDSSNNWTDRNRSSSRDSYDLPSDPETISPAKIGFLKSSDPSIPGFVIYAYPFRKKRFSGKQVRHRVVVVFSSLPSNEVYEERRRIVEQWENVLNCLCRDIHVNDVSTCAPPPRGKLLILINPHSGPGKAHSIFRNEIEPMLQEANIPYKEMVTEYAGHARDLMKEISFAEWHGIVIVSGDGLIFETINGIMSRGDWASSIHVPIGCLPGGSANALCCSINYSAGEPFDKNIVLHSTFVLIKHRVVPMDLVMVHLPDRTLYSFLSLAWGIVADIDFESEKYRSLGEARFTIGAFLRILGLRTYRGKVSFLPVAEYTPKESPDSNKKVLSKIRRFSLRSRSSSKSTISSSDSSSSPRLLRHRSLSMDPSLYSATYTDNYSHNHISQDKDVNLAAYKNGIDKMPENGKVEFPNAGLNHSIGVHNDDISALRAATAKVSISTHYRTVQSEKDLPQTMNAVPLSSLELSSKEKIHPGNSSVSSLEDPEDLNENAGKNSPSSSRKSAEGLTVMEETRERVVEEEMYQGQKKDYEPVPSPLLPPLDEPVPDNWVSVEGKFVLVCGVYQTHLGTEMLAAPDAHLNDGFIHLMIVREGISRNALLNLFLSFGEGTQVHSPHVEIVKVLALRLEPETEEGNLTIDGERFDPSPCQAQILPGIAKIMAIK